MIYRLRLWKGLLYPKQTFFQLRQAEAIYGLRPRVFLLFLLSAGVFFISGFYGIGSHVFSFLLPAGSAGEYEWLKLFFAAGRLILGLLFAGLVLYFQSLWFWTLSDVPFKKLVVIQSFVLPILLMEKLICLALAVQMNLPWYSSPFSLGPAAHYMTKYPFLIYLMGCLTLFKFLVIALQFYGLRQMSSQRPIYSFLIVVGIHIIFWMSVSLLAYLDFQMIL